MVPLESHEAEGNPLEGMECANEQLSARYDLNRPEAAPVRCTICSEHSTRTSRSTVSKPAERSRNFNTQHTPKPAGRERSPSKGLSQAHASCLSQTGIYQWHCIHRGVTAAVMQWLSRKRGRNGRMDIRQQLTNHPTKETAAARQKTRRPAVSALTKESSSKEALIEDMASQASLVRLQAKGHSIRG